MFIHESFDYIYGFFTVYNQRLGNVSKFQNAGANFHTFLVIKVQNVRDQISGRRYKRA